MLALATAIGQERPSSGRLLSVLASMAGVAVIAVGNLGDRSPEGRDALLGDLLEVFAVISWGAYLTVGKPLVARYGSLPTLAGTFLVGAAARPADRRGDDRVDGRALAAGLAGGVEGARRISCWCRRSSGCSSRTCRSAGSTRARWRPSATPRPC